MFPERPVENGRSSKVGTAVWCQLAVAGLLVVLGMVSVVGRLLFADMWSSAPWSGSPIRAGGCFALAAWLTAAAFGLRRRSPNARWLSLAGLVAAVVVAAGVAALQGDLSFAVMGDDQEVLRYMGWVMLSSLVSTAAAGAALALSVAAFVLLLAGPYRAARPGP